MPLLIFIASFHNSASVWKVRRMDYACGAVSVVGTVVWLVTRNGVLAISAAIAADFLAGVPTLMKSWTHPQTETVHSYIGALISMVVLLLTVDHWTFDVVAFPLFVAVHGHSGVARHRPRARPALPAAPASGASRTAARLAGGRSDALSAAAW